MEYQLSSTSTAPLVEISLKNGEEIQIESGAMVYHNKDIKLEGRMNSNGKTGIGGIISALGRSLTSGESIFITKVKSVGPNGQITLAPATLGSVKVLNIGEEQWYLNTTSFLASENGIEYVMERQKLDGALFGGTGGFFVMKTRGAGKILVSGYGDITEVILDGSEEVIVDNYHVLAWSENLNYSIEVASGFLGVKTGEGLVNRFRGQGKILIQSRNIEALAQTIIPFLPNKD
jgi:TIGR00266 family protein